MNDVGSARFSRMDRAASSICLTEFSPWAWLRLSSGELYMTFSPIRLAISWKFLLSSLHSPAGSSLMVDMIGRFRFMNRGFFLALITSVSIRLVNSFLKIAWIKKKYPEHISRSTMVYLLPFLERSLHVMTSPQNVCPTRCSMYGEVLENIFLNDPRRRLHTMHFPSWLPMCPCLMCSSSFVIRFSRLFIPAFAPNTIPSVSLNM